MGGGSAYGLSGSACPSQIASHAGMQNILIWHAAPGWYSCCACFLTGIKLLSLQFHASVRGGAWLVIYRLLIQGDCMGKSNWAEQMRERMHGAGGVAG